MMNIEVILDNKKITLICLLLGCTQGLLVQVLENKNTCFNNAVFWCTTEDFPFLSWDIDTKKSRQIFFDIDSNDPVNTTYNYILNSTEVTSVVTFNNGTFINATLSILGAASINNTQVSCNGDSSLLIFHEVLLIYYSEPGFSSLELMIVSIQDIESYFILIPQRSSNNSDIPYILRITPPPPYGPQEITSSSDAVISLENSVEYNLTLWWRICENAGNINFMFVIECTIDNETVILECGMNGIWNSNVTDLCATPNTKPLPTTETIATVIQDATTVTYDAEITTCVTSDLPKPRTFEMELIFGIIGTFIITVIFGLTLGFLCGIVYKQKRKESSFNKQATQSHNEESLKVVHDDPIYESINLSQINTNIRISKNISYVKTGKK